MFGALEVEKALYSRKHRVSHAALDRRAAPETRDALHWLPLRLSNPHRRHFLLRDALVNGFTARDLHQIFHVSHSAISLDFFVRVASDGHYQIIQCLDFLFDKVKDWEESVDNGVEDAVADPV